MAFRYLNAKKIAQIHAKSSTCLLLIDCQLGFRNLNAWGGNGVSNPAFEDNIKALLATFREESDKKPIGERPLIIHAQYRPVWTDHPLHVTDKGPWGKNGDTKRGIDFLECAIPRVRDPRNGVVKFLESFDEPPIPDPNAPPQEKKVEGPRPPPDEILMTSHGHSVFINTPLQKVLNDRKIRTLLVAGMSTDQYVSTAVRMAHNLALVGQLGGHGNMEDTATCDLWTDGVAIYGKLPGEEGDELSVDMMRIVLVGDATRAIGKGGFDAQVIHDVHLESLKDFAEIRTTAEILGAFQ
jgi:nicotinamidase-related amidase